MNFSGLRLRRAVFAAVAAFVLALLTGLMAWTLTPGGWSPAKAAILLCFAVTSVWNGLCAANGVFGFVRLLAPAPPPCGGAASDARLPRLAIAVTIRDEPMQTVLPPLRRLLDELDRAAALPGLTLFVLSDTAAGAMATAEAAAVERFRRGDPQPHRIVYRRRPANAGFKAGNVIEFLDTLGSGFEAMLLLDADSRMSGPAVLRLARAMRDDPHLGIIQHLTVGAPARLPCPRLFQFGMRAGMRVWATGQDWWQQDCGPYWGHNALIRVAPFRAHCRLQKLPGGDAILSHDQVEAAMMAASGWGVRVLAEEDGSAEVNPPALPEFLRRERRWLTGNLQYRHLIAAPGLQRMGRWQLAQAMLMFAQAPFYVLLAECAAIEAASASPGYPAARVLATALAWAATLHAPKLLGYAETMLSARKRARYGGLARFAAGVTAETAFTLLLDPIMLFSKAVAVAGLCLGRFPMGWDAQNRAGRSVGWAESAKLFWPHTAFGVLLFAGFAAGSWSAAIWALPFAGGLLAAIPFCVATASPRLGEALARAGIAAIPEELAGAPADTALVGAAPVTAKAA